MKTVQEILEMARNGKISSIEDLEKMGYDVEKIFRNHMPERKALTTILSARRRREEEKH